MNTDEKAVSVAIREIRGQKARSRHRGADPTGSCRENRRLDDKIPPLVVIKTPEMSLSGRYSIKAIMQKITPFLWFDSEAEQAAKFLYLHLQEIENSQCHPLSGYRPGNRRPGPGQRHDGRFHHRRPAIHGAQRRTGLQVQRVDFLSRIAKAILSRFLLHYRERAAQLQCIRETFFVIESTHINRSGRIRVLSSSAGNGKCPLDDIRVGIAMFNDVRSKE